MFSGYPTVIIPIIELNGGVYGNVQLTDVYPAVDVTDQTQSPTGTTKPYKIVDLYTDLLSSIGYNTYSPCLAASTVNLNATYNNGISGVGATLTNSGSHVAFILDGSTGILGGRYVIKNQNNPAQNGIYTLTTVGDTSTAWILTRSVDFNSTSNIKNNGLVYVTGGSTNSSTLWQDTFTAPLVIGTSAIDWNQYQVVLPSYPLPLVDGGTGKDLSSAGSVGGIVYLSNSTQMNIINGTATANEVLISGSNSAPSWSSLSTLMDNVFGNAHGDILFRGSLGWEVLAPGSAGQILKSNGPGNDVAWENVPGTGTINSGGINDLAWYAANGTTISGLPTANNGVLVTSNTGVPSISSTLPTNLTVPSPYINNIYDSVNHLEVLSITGVATAVNYINFTNAVASSNPFISAAGSDTNIYLTLTGKGTGGVNLHGVTDGSNASTGDVGEIISSSVAASTVSLSTGTTANLTSISLTAGSWRVSGVVLFLADTTTIISNELAGISKTSATMPSVTTVDISQPTAFNQITFGAGRSSSLTITDGIIEVSSGAAPQTIYLVANSNFTTSTCTAGGMIVAERRR